MSALRFVHSYLTNRMQRTKINSEYSSWKKLFGVPQGSIPGVPRSTDLNPGDRLVSTGL